MVGEKKIKKEMTFLMNTGCSWRTLLNCFLIVACSGGKCDLLVEVITVMVVLLLLLE